MNETLETGAAVKNGSKRFVFALLAIVLEVAVILLVVLRFEEQDKWVALALRVVSTILVLLIYNQDKTAQIKMTWMIIIMAAPVFGVTLYLLIGLNGRTHAMRSRYKEVDAELLPLLPDGDETLRALDERDRRAANIARYVKTHSGYPLYDNTKITYYDDASKGLEAQRIDLARAQDFIFMEYHAIEDSTSWHSIQDVLAKRVAAGVDVRVFYDDMGSIGFVNTDFVKRLEAVGIKAKVFNPFAPGLNLFLNNRDHRKITVIDGRVGFTGGYNLADEYFHVTEPFGHWKDTGLRLEGPAVKSLTVAFLEMWEASEKYGTIYDRISEKSLKFLPDVAGAETEDTALETAGAPPEGVAAEASALPEDAGMEATAAPKASAAPEGPTASRGFVLPYADSPMDNEQVGEDVYISVAEYAKDYVWYVTPYLIVTDEMIHAFGLAAKRGVDVRIVTPGIPDKKIVYALTRSYYHSLVRSGVRIYEYTPGFCHAKMSVADDVLATCGTINLDYRSLYHHFENGCLYYGCEAVEQTKADFEWMFAQSREVTDDYRNPTYGLRFWHLLLRLLAPLM